MVLPAAIIQQPLSFGFPEFRRHRLISHIERILVVNSLTPAQASSIRGRLFFSFFWHHKARSYFVYPARRQYAQTSDIGSHRRTGEVGCRPAIEAAYDAEAWLLSEELVIAFYFFLDLLRSDSF